MAFNNKISLKVAEQFPDFVQADTAGVITFLEKYYQFMESAELKLTNLGATDRILLEEGTTNFIVLQNEGPRSNIGVTGTDRFLLQDYDQFWARGHLAAEDDEDTLLPAVKERSIVSQFQNDETITGATSKATATVRVEDINGNSRLFISAQSKFLIGEIVTGGTSLATAEISGYRANPVENISQLMKYADIDDTIDSFFDQFKNEILKTIPKTLTSSLNKRKLLKNITDLYRSKGTRKAHELFFRILLNENVDVYYPTIDMIRISDGNWNDATILRVVPDNDTLLMEDDIDDSIFLMDEDGAHISMEDSTNDASDIAKLEGQTITQLAVRDVSTELAGLHHPDTVGYVGDTVPGTVATRADDPGFPTGGHTDVGLATAKVESVTQFQLSDASVSELVLSDNSVSGTFVSGQNITGLSNVNETLTITAKVGSIITDTTITSTGQYYATTDSVGITTTTGTDATVTIDSLTPGTISEIIVSTVGTGYAIGDTISVDNSSTNGAGLSAKISVVNGGIAPETGSLIEQFRFTLENEPGELLDETSADGSANGISLEAGTSGQPGEIITEDGFYITQEGTVSTLVYFTQEEDYEMAAADHIVLENHTVYSDSLSGDKIVQESGTGSGDITDVRILGIGENYTSLPTLSITTSGGSAGKVIAKGSGSLGKIRALSIDDPGIHYTDTVTLTVQVNLLTTAVSGTFTGLETLTGGTSAATATFKSIDTDTEIIKITVLTGTFSVGETITGGLSGATAVIDSIESSSMTGIIGTSTEKTGSYINQDGFISESSKKIQDSYYYQDYSYVIKIGTAISEWRNDLNQSIHPAGWAVFGQIDTVSTLNARIKSVSTTPEAVTARETLTPELFSTFETIFQTQLNVHKAARAAVVTTSPIIWTSLTISRTQGGAGVRVGNAETYRFYNKTAVDSSVTFRSHRGYYENRERTTLNEGGTLSNSDTTITLTDASQFPTQGTIVIESEQITYTGKSSNDLTGCTRGADIQGTTSAATHADGTAVYNFKFIHTNEESWRVQDWGTAVIGDVTSYPQKRYHVPVPGEITLSYS